MDYSGLATFKKALEDLPDIDSVENVEADGNIICGLSIETRSLGQLSAERLESDDAQLLFDFYSEGLSEKTRRLFAPYPLFDTAPRSVDELAQRITGWKKENDWTAIKLVKETRIIGFAVLKRFWTDQVTSGIAIRDEFHRKGLGSLLQHIIVQQARLLGIEKFHIKVVSDNLSSVKLHEKCGFRQTRILPPMYEETLEYLDECDRKNGVEPPGRRIVEMVVDLGDKKNSGKTLTVEDFSRAFGVGTDEVSEASGSLISSLDFRYADCAQNAREELLLDALRKCDTAELAVSGPHRIDDWRRGWGEILHDFRANDGRLETLIPKDLHPGRPLRWQGNYIVPFSNSFEHDFATVFRHWIYKKYFRAFSNIYEFGCGTGQNLAILAELFPDKRLFGMDWVPESQELLSALSRRYSWKIEGVRFDAFNPDHDLDLLPDSVVYTSCALEQLGSAYGGFIEFLLAKKPSLCVNVECLVEYYDESALFDYVALRYHKRRNYLDRFLTRLRELEREKVVEIVATKRTGFGSLYHEGYMYVVWRAL